MKLALFLWVLVFSSSALAYRSPSLDHSVHVHGYTKRDGTHVDDHYRSRPHQDNAEGEGGAKKRNNG